MGNYSQIDTPHFRRAFPPCLCAPAWAGLTALRAIPFASLHLCGLARNPNHRVVFRHAFAGPNFNKLVKTILPFIFAAMIQPYLFIAETENKGRGVFTRESIPEGTVIEIAPVIAMPAKDRPLLDQTLLHDYIFVWGHNEDQCCMALGWVPVYNHSYTSNCEYFMDYDTDMMFIKTVRTIAAFEEVTINYNGDWNNAEPVWFDVKF